MATYTGGTSIWGNNTDQLYIWGDDTANATTSTTAGVFTTTGTTASTDGIIWTNAYNAYMYGGLDGSIQMESTAVGNQTIRVEPEVQLNIRPAQPGEFTVNIFHPQRIQGPEEAPEEAPVVQRIATISPKDQPQVIANARGQDLLKEIVGEVVYRRFQKQGWIDVPSLEKPGIMYRIQPWHEIALLEKNAKKEWVSNHQSICIHAREAHVEGDEVAAHVLLCRYNEKTLWKMGNLHGVRRAA